MPVFPPIYGASIPTARQPPISGRLNASRGGHASASSDVSAGGGRVLKIVTEMGSSMVGSGLSPFGQNAASTIRDSREREKKEMSDLNDRLASYIEKVCGQ